MVASLVQTAAGGRRVVVTKQIRPEVVLGSVDICRLLNATYCPLWSDACRVSIVFCISCYAIDMAVALYIVKHTLSTCMWPQICLWSVASRMQNNQAGFASSGKLQSQTLVLLKPFVTPQSQKLFSISRCQGRPDGVEGRRD